MECSSIGLHFQHQYHLLVSVLILSQVQNRQVRHLFSFQYIFIEKQDYLGNSGSMLLMGYISSHLPSFWNKGPSSTISMAYTSEGNTDNTIEVGQGSLKLLYSVDEGKLTHYVNSRNQVCFAVDDLVSQCSDILLIWLCLCHGMDMLHPCMLWSFWSRNWKGRLSFNFHAIIGWDAFFFFPTSDSANLSKKKRCLFFFHVCSWMMDIFLQLFNIIPPHITQVTALVEQSYSYYSGNDGTDKDPQVGRSAYVKA